MAIFQNDLKDDVRAKTILSEIETVGHISTTNDAFAKKLFRTKISFWTS
ncbi:hypothetical protein [Succinivibrio dextrinosolvens]|nr:hypothetical protein [Succinivibrio dextrinosolvens]